MKNKSILIIGGTGFVGFHLAKKCLSLKLRVTIISLNKPKKFRKLRKVKYINFNIANYKKLKSVINPKKFNYVVNLGGYVNHKNKKKLVDGHLKSTQNLANLFLNQSLTKFIQIGSSAEYGSNNSPHYENMKCKPVGLYGIYKYKASTYLLNNKKIKFDFKILRFYQLYGPYQDLNRFLPQLIYYCLNKMDFPTSNGKQYRDFLFIDDAITAIIKTLKAPKTKFKIFNIGYGSPINLKKIMILADKKTKGLRAQFGKIKLRLGEKKIIYPDIKLSKKILNWQPKTTFENGFEKTLKYYKNNLANFI